MKNRKLLSYAQDFISFLTFNLKEDLWKEIKRIVLFGSVSRSEAGKESDIDLFIEVKLLEKEIEKATEDIVEKFYESPKFSKYWKLLRIENPIRCMFGKISEWKDIHPSIIQEGIVLYEKYRPETIDGRPLILFSWENVKPESRRVMLSRKLFGYTKNKRRYPGLIEQYSGEKISKGSAVVPLEHRKVFEALFKSYKISAKVYPVVELV